MASEQGKSVSTSAKNGTNNTRQGKRHRQRATPDKQNPPAQDKAQRGKPKQLNEPGERREFSNPEINVSYKLNTQEVIRLQQRHYNNISRSLFNLSINSSHLERLGQKGAVERTKEAVGNILAAPEKEVDAGITALTSALAKASQDGQVEEISYTAPREYDIKIRTPDAMRVVTLLRKLDHLITLIDRLWLNNRFNQDEVDDYKTRQRDSFRNMAEVLERHSSATVNELNESNGQAASNNDTSVKPDVDAQVGDTPEVAS